MTFPRFVLKLAKKSYFHKSFPTELAQCLLVVIVRGRKDEGCWLLFVTASNLLVLRRLSYPLTLVQTAKSVLAAS